MNASDFLLPPCGQAALDFAKRGVHVFPVPPGSKKSHKKAEHSGGRAWGATTDPDEIVRDWRRWPEANLGLVTGPKSGFFVVEADTAEGHEVDGIGNLAALIEEHGGWDETIEAYSPSGSWHIYFRWPEEGGVYNTQGEVARGVDVRGDGGMVVAPPSVKPGQPQAYHWKNPPGRFVLAECPPWLLHLCRAASRKDHNATSGSGARAGTLRAAAWAETALREEIGRVLSAPQGQRNAALNRAAFALGQIVGGGSLEEADVRARLSGAGFAAGLEAVEIEATVTSGMAAGIAEPRTPPEDRRGGGEGSQEDAADAEPPEEADGIDLSHDALARDLGMRSWDENAKHVAGWGHWLFWDGRHWTRDQTLQHMTRARAYLRKRADEITRWAEKKAEGLDPKEVTRLEAWAKSEARTLRSANTVAAVTGLARSNAASVAGPTDFDANPWLLGTPGGTVDLRTGELRPAKREDMITRLTAVAPEEGIPTRFLAFLNEIFDGDRELIAFVQRAAGYALTGETREHKLLFFYGTGRNGKSVFLNILVHILNEYARRAHATTFLNTNGEKHPTDLAGLQGARLVVGSELPKGKTWDESAIKNLTGGDVVTARFMRGDFFDYTPQFTLMIAGNTMPSFKGVDEALRARAVLVPFTVTIPEEQRDRLLPEKLKAEAGKILSWAIQGALQWQRMGLAVPERVAAASRDYLDGEDTLGQFLADETAESVGAFVLTADLHQRFKQWCDKQGLAAWTTHSLTKALKERGIQDARRMIGRGFLGLRLA